MKRKILKLHFLRFINNKLFFISTLVFSLFSVGYLMVGLYRDIQAGDDLFQFVYTLWNTNKTSIYSFAFFLLISYEFCSKLYINKLDEAVRCTSKGLSSISFYNVSVLMIYNVFYSFILLLYNCIIFLVMCSFEQAFILHVFFNILVNIFLVNTFAIMFGFAVSFFKSKILSYLFIVVYLILGSKIGESLANAIVISTDNRFNAFKIFDFLNVFPPNMDWTPTYAMGFSILPYRIILLLVWIFIFLTVGLCFIKSHKTKTMSVISIVLVIVFTISYFQPEAKLILNDNPEGEALADQYYYLNYDGEYSEAVFNVEKYDLRIKIDREFNCSSTMNLDCNSDEFVFTLYHGFRINEITDQQGNHLEFSRDGDYVSVFSVQNINSVTIDYSGTGKGFYSNYQGLYLPGDFPYYPVAGKHVIYDDTYKSVTPNNTPEFSIIVSSNLQVYSNLKSDEKNVFYGKTKVPCLFAGFLKTLEYEGMTLIYPYLYGETIYLEQILQDIEPNKFYGKTVFIEPHVNISFESFSREYEDVVLTSAFGGLVIDEREVEKLD